LDSELLKRLENNELKCSVCGLIIPFSYPKKAKGASRQEFTIPSFTLVDSKPVCYRDYHPKEFKTP
jgi:hypothetical protein